MKEIMNNYLVSLRRTPKARSSNIITHQPTHNLSTIIHQNPEEPIQLFSVRKSIPKNTEVLRERSEMIVHPSYQFDDAARSARMSQDGSRAKLISTTAEMSSTSSTSNKWAGLSRIPEISLELIKKFTTTALRPAPQGAKGLVKMGIFILEEGKGSISEELRLESLPDRFRVRLGPWKLAIFSYPGFRWKLARKSILIRTGLFENDANNYNLSITI